MADLAHESGVNSGVVTFYESGVIRGAITLFDFGIRGKSGGVDG